MIEAVAFCPQAPALVPLVGLGLDAELGRLRAACREAIRRAAARAELIVAVGTGERTREHAPTARGTFAGYGVALELPLGSDDPGTVELPPALTVAAWLLRDALGAGCGARGWSLGCDAAPLALDPRPATALLVMGDGSARRDVKAPGYFDERAQDYDAAVNTALGSGDPTALTALDLDLGRRQLAAGAPVWSTVGKLLERRYTAEVLSDEAPFGVGYFVAAWQ